MLATLLLFYFHQSGSALFVLIVVGVSLLLNHPVSTQFLTPIGLDAVWIACWYLLPISALVFALPKKLKFIPALISILALLLLFLIAVFVAKSTLADQMAILLSTGFIDDKSLGIFAGIPQIAALFVIATMAILALIRDGHIVLFVLIFATASLWWFPEPSTLFVAGAAIVSLLVMMQESYYLAYYDELTQIPNRRALYEAMSKLGSKYTIAMSDIDFFKKFNDTHGHDAGDLVLKMVANKLAKVRGGGKAYRFGGEEFTILFDTKEDATPYLEEVRKLVESSALTYKGKKLQVTVSIGACKKSDSQSNYEEVLKSADEALYKAKEAGRNKVITI